MPRPPDSDEYRAPFFDAGRFDLQTLLNSTPGSSMVIDLKGHIHCANQRALQHFAAELGTLAGQNLFELCGPDAAATYRAKLDDVVKRRRSIAWYSSADGGLARKTMVPLLDGNGVACHALFFLDDCADYGGAALAMKSKGLHSHFMPEHSADRFWELDSELRFTFISASDRRERGYRPEEVIGQSVYSILTAASAAQLKRDVAVWLSRESECKVAGSTRFELEIMRKDGSTLWVEAHATPRRDAGGALVGFHGTARDITKRKLYEIELEEANKQLRQQVNEISERQTGLQQRADRDFLTGLYNRRYLYETLPRELARAKRENYPVSLIMLDLDHFKHVNDTYGHATGDEALKTLSSILQRGARSSDVAARYGGEEFLIVLPCMSNESARQRAEAWRAEFGKTPIIHGRNKVNVTLSAGIATFPDNGEVLESLIHLADAALYRAKSNGRNRVEHFEPLDMAAGTFASLFTVKWKAAYASGNPTIDDEHRKLFELANALLERAFDSGVAREVLNTTFDAFLSCLVAHFSHEEAILRTYKYERANGHADEHRRLLERALHLRRKVQDGEGSVGDLVDFIGNDIVALHILTVDRAFYPVFAEPGLPAGL